MLIAYKINFLIRFITQFMVKAETGNGNSDIVGEKRVWINCLQKQILKISLRLTNLQLLFMVSQNCE